VKPAIKAVPIAVMTAEVVSRPMNTQQKIVPLFVVIIPSCESFTELVEDRDHHAARSDQMLVEHRRRLVRFAAFTENFFKCDPCHILNPFIEPLYRMWPV